MAKKRDQPKRLDWLRCPACSSRQVLYAKREGCHWCRICGTTFMADVKAKKCHIPRKR